MLNDEIKQLDDELFSDKNCDLRAHNAVLLDIHEGNLLQYVLDDLRTQLTPMAFKDAKHRVAPVNLLPKIVGKLSQVFEKPPSRKAVGLSGEELGEKDQDLLSWYETKLDINVGSVQANEYLNLHRSFAYEPYIDNGQPKLRVIPSDRFHVFALDPSNPLRMTHFVKILGDTMGPSGKHETLYVVYTDSEIRAYFKGGKPAMDYMSRKDMDGTNPFGKIPFVYCVRSKISITPKPDKDTLQMTKLIPVLLTDLNYAVMYLSFGMTWIKNCIIDGDVRAPNAILQLKPANKTDDGANMEIGTIKPEVDTDKVLALIQSTLTMWMDSKNIKPGSMGDITVQNAASGISKAIDEMDTSADRKKQVPFLKNADEELFELVLNHMHPIWMKSIQGFDKPIMPSKGLEIVSSIAEQRPITDKSKDIGDQKTMIEMKIQSRRGALVELYPDWEEAQIEERLQEVEDETKDQTPDPMANIGSTKPNDQGNEPNAEIPNGQPLEAKKEPELVS